MRFGRPLASTPQGPLVAVDTHVGHSTVAQVDKVVGQQASRLGDINVDGRGPVEAHAGVDQDDGAARAEVAHDVVARARQNERSGIPGLGPAHSG